jgi:hypothetical protein
LGLSIEAKGGVYEVKGDGEGSETKRMGEELAKASGSEVVATDELTSPKGTMEVEETIN